ncbi:MAG: acyl-CoA dehydrogenase family protein, partial [Nitrospirota bacterium]
MDLDFTEEQRMIREMTRKFAEEEIVPSSRRNDITENFPREIIDKMAQVGLLGGPVPKAYGGSDLDYISHAIVTEEIGRADSSVRTTISVQISLVELTILKWGSEEQKKKYLPQLCSGRMIGCFGLTEPDAGSDAANQSTSARNEGGDWIIDGRKIWISNGDFADIAIIFAQTDKEKGYEGITAFLVEKETPGFSTRRISGKLGLRASDTAELILEGCRVPAGSMLVKEGEGFKIAMSALDNGRYSVAAGCVGIIQGCLDLSSRYARERKQFGKPIGAFQLVQDMIARMAVDLEAARLLVYKAGHLKNKGLQST